MISHLLVRRLPSRINSTMANSFFHVLSHGGAWTLSVQTWRKGELQEVKQLIASLQQYVIFSHFKEEGIQDVSAKYQ